MDGESGSENGYSRRVSEFSRAELAKWIRLNSDTRRGWRMAGGARRTRASGVRPGGAAMSGQHGILVRVTTTSTAASPTATTWIARALLAAFGVALALIVLLPSEGHRVLGLVETLAGIVSRAGIPYQFAFMTLEFGANIALFVPLGVLLPSALARPASTATRGLEGATLFGTVCLGAAISVLIELAQQVIPGRVSSPADVLANTLGTLLGVLILVILRRSFASGSRKTHMR